LSSERYLTAEPSIPIIAYSLVVIDAGHDMRFLTVLTILLSIFTCGSKAHASACSAAKQQYHSAIDSHEKKFAADVRKAVGLYPKDVDSRKVEHCIKVVPVQRAALPSIDNIVHLAEAARRACPKMRAGFDDAKSASEYDRSGAAAPDAAKQNALKWISVCEARIAAANPSAPEMRIANAPSVSGASAPSPAKPATARRPWSGLKKDCNAAGQLERNTAAWSDMCVPAGAPQRVSAYRPSIDPQKLTLRAKETCGSVPLDSQRGCIMDAKAKILLSEDAGVRAKCSSEPAEALMSCIDFVYLYGPAGPSNAELRGILNFYHGSSVGVVNGEYKPGAASAPPTGCEPGFGMKPTPGGFGGWSCQKLGVIYLAPNRRPPGQSDSTEAEGIRIFEEQVNEVAAIATAAAATDATQLIAEERKACTGAAFVATRSVLKGGAPEVPEKCHPMADAARAELAYYAGARIRTWNPGVEELLSALDTRNQSAAGLNGGAPGPQRRDAAASDCVQAESHWKAAEDLKLLALYEDHLARFAACNFATLATARIEQLRKK
jgi:hypothetical protein